MIYRARRWIVPLPFKSALRMQNSLRSNARTFKVKNYGLRQLAIKDLKADDRSSVLTTPRISAWPSFTRI